MTVHPVRSLTLELPPSPNSLSQLFEDLNRRLPANASIRDADSFLQMLRSFRRDLLTTLVDVRLDHDANNAALAFPKLIANNLRDFGLIAVVFVGVA